MEDDDDLVVVDRGDTTEAVAAPGSPPLLVASPGSDSWTLLESSIDEATQELLSLSSSPAPEAEAAAAAGAGVDAAKDDDDDDDDDDGLAKEELDLEDVSRRLRELEKNIGDLTSSELLRRLDSSDTESPRSAKQVASFLAEPEAALPSEADDDADDCACDADDCDARRERFLGQFLLALALVLSLASLWACVAPPRARTAPRLPPQPRWLARDRRPAPPPAAFSRPEVPEASGAAAAASAVVVESGAPTARDAPKEEPPSMIDHRDHRDAGAPRGRRSATKDAFRAAHRADADFLSTALSHVETRLSRAASDLDRTLRDFDAADAAAQLEAQLGRANRAVLDAKRYLANSTVERVARDAARALADPETLPKYLAGATMGGLGLLVGVPFVPGVTDNLVVGLAGAVLPFLSHEDANESSKAAATG